MRKYKCIYQLNTMWGRPTDMYVEKGIYDVYIDKQTNKKYTAGKELFFWEKDFDKMPKITPLSNFNLIYNQHQKGVDVLNEILFK